MKLEKKHRSKDENQKTTSTNTSTRSENRTHATVLEGQSRLSPLHDLCDLLLHKGYTDVWIPLQTRCFRNSLSVPYQLKLGVL